MPTPVVEPQPQVHAPLPKSTTLVRLHITPFSHALYTTLIPAPLQALAARSGAGPSFHAVETFPERGFGYIDLPAADAQRLKQKLHGTTLRGMKLRVEAAHPEKTSKQHTDHADPASSTVADTRSPQKARGAASSSTEGDGVFHGVEMPAGRMVKRGWAEAPGAAKDDKKKHRKPTSAEEREHEKKKKPRRAKLVDTSQMIFRTALPANVASKAAEGDEVANKRRKTKQGSKVKTEVKEFERTNKFPTFLRDTLKGPNAVKGASEFVDGQGWVDGDGNVVEKVKATRKPKQRIEAGMGSAKAHAVKGKKQEIAVVQEQDEEDSGEESEESSIVSSDSESEVSHPSAVPSDRGDESGDSEEHEEIDSPETPAKSVLPSISTTPAPSKEVHPLEALFKRPASRDKKPENLAPINTAFSFFGGAGGSDAYEQDVDDSGLMRPPQTPFTQRDLEHRGMRSAAPTPDTAAIGKRFRLPSVDSSTQADSDEDEEDKEDDADNVEDVDMPDVGFGGQKIEHELAGPADDAAEGNADKEVQNEFEKHFWAHRGEYNRAWKQRKREARKERRQGENRRGTGLRGKN